MNMDEEFMREALNEAKKAMEKGEVPIGAVLVHKGDVIARAHNLREIEKKATAHAEILLIEKGNRELDKWRLTDTTLYVTMEPCAMCGGAILQSRISRLVFGVYDLKSGAAGSVINLFEIEDFNHRVDVTGGVLEKESKELLQAFFQGLRKNKKTIE